MYFAPFFALLLDCVMIWVLYAWVCLGLGWPFVRFFRRDNLQPSDFVWCFWIGLAALLGLLQLIHLFVAINGFAFVLMVVLGLFFSIGALPLLFQCAAQISAGRKWMFLFIAFGIAFWIADRGAGHPWFYDSGLYHIPAMKWIGEYRIIPGLANVHIRLGFTSSITLLAAMMDHGFLAGNAAHLTNGFMLMALAVMVIRGVMGFWTDKSAARPDHWVMLFAAVAVTEWALDTQISSISTDLATVSLSLASAAAFLQLFSVGIDDRRRHFLAFTCLTLCAASLSAKMSAGPFSAPLALGALWGTVRIPSSWLARIGRVITACSLGTVITVLWLIRQVILSGYPLFPSPLITLNVDWRVPKEKVRAMQYATLDFARAATLGNTRHNYQWLHEWWHTRIEHSWNLFKGPYPFALGVLCFIITLIFFRPRLKRLAPGWRSIGWMLFAILLGLIEWFKAAPDVRFSSQLFYLIFGTGAAVLTAVLIGQSSRQWLRLVPLVLAIAVAMGPPLYQSMVDNHSITMFPEIAFNPPGPDSGFEYTWIHTGFGHTIIPPNVIMYLPAPGDGDRVWDAPLPNEPTLNPDLRLRNPPNVRDGFRDATLPGHVTK